MALPLLLGPSLIGLDSTLLVLVLVLSSLSKSSSSSNSSSLVLFFFPFLLFFLLKTLICLINSKSEISSSLFYLSYCSVESLKFISLHFKSEVKDLVLSQVSNIYFLVSSKVVLYSSVISMTLEIKVGLSCLNCFFQNILISPFTFLMLRLNLE